MLELERFTRALRLRWLWFQWKHKDRAWKALDLPCDSHDHELFAALTFVTVGNGKTAKFWTSSWANGKTPKSMAPNLFHKSKRKRLTVQMAVQENRWINHILSLQTEQELREYMKLWELTSSIQLQEGTEDSIRWRWTQDGEYTTKSAYQIQFEGTYNNLKLMPIWKAQAEPKCRFFA
jgi:hypothetical protein